MKRAPRFYVLDFDRTLGDTAHLYSEFIAAVSMVHPEAVDVLHQAVQRAKDDETVFDAYHVLENVMSPEEVGRCARLFIEAMKTRHDSVYPDAKQFLSWLNETRQPYGIMSRGGPEWQQIKIAAAHLEEVPCLIIASDHEHTKVEIMTSWRNTQGVFELPAEFAGREVEQLVLVDDKPTEFLGLPYPGITGVMVDRLRMGEVGIEGVRVVTSLVELIE